jgi:hypothetical protein
MRRSSLIATGITAFTVGVLPASASAETFCVEDPACSGAPHGTVKAAFEAAVDNGPGPDRIQIGAGTFSESNLIDSGGSPLTIVGAGPATVITRPPAPNVGILRLRNPDSTVSGLTLSVPDGGPNMVGLELSGGASADRVAVTADAGANDVEGVLLVGGRLERSIVGLPNTVAASNDGVRLAGGGTHLTSSRVSATRGVRSTGASNRVTGSRIQGRVGIELEGEGVNSGTTVDNTQVLMLAGPGAEAGVKVTQRSNSTATLEARHLTVDGVNGSGVGVLADGNVNLANAHAVVNLNDSLVQRFATDLEAKGGPQGKGTITVGSSAFDFTKVEATNLPLETVGVIPGTNVNLNGADPGVTSVLGDFRPAFNSVLVDRGVPGGLLAGEPTTDLFGLPRLVDGNGDGTLRRDIGAFEYQRSAPAIGSAGATPTTVGIGEPISLSATATDADPGESPGFTWTFDDGGSASGDSVQHAWATPGAHTATVTATDPAGASSSATVAVTVNAPPAAPLQPALADGAVALTIGTKTIKLSKRGVAAVPVSCPATEVSGPCTGVLTLTTDQKVRRSRRAKAKKQKLGSKRFSVPAGRTVKVNVKLSRANLKLMRRLKRTRVRAAATVVDAAGNSGKAAARFQLRAR